MNKLAIVGNNKNVYNLCILNDDLSQVLQAVQATEEQIVQFSGNMGCLNFSVSGGKVVQDCGVFSRLSNTGLSMIVLKTLCTKSGRVVGYSVMNTKTLTIGNAKRERLIEMQKSQSEPIFQNAIIRNDTINAYPNKQFERQIVGVSERSVRPAKKPEVQREVKPEQHIPEFISNPDLSNAQRKLLLDGKKRGALVEYYNNPKIKPECMDLYNNLIVDKNIAEDCKPIFQNTDLNSQQAYELYRCALLGLDYSDLNNANLTPSEMELGRMDKSMDMWNEVDYAEEPNGELFEKVCRMKEHSFN